MSYLHWMAAAILLVPRHSCWARSYRDIELVHAMSQPDPMRNLYIQQRENGLLQKNLTELPPTTNTQDPRPPTAPLQAPTLYPAGSPSLDPSISPSLSPTTVPTIGDPYPPANEPLDPEPWYFNYNTSDGAKYGPGTVGLAYQANGFFKAGIRNDNWGKASRPPNDYWLEFTGEGFGPWKSVLDVHGPTQNKCSTGTLQSPIDVRENGASCREHHEVRSLPGDFQVSGRRVEKRIQSNKLRLVYERRPCSNLNVVACQEPDPPHADFPNGFGGFADVTHIDFKVESEHMIWNEKFDAEMQIFHIHPGRRRLVAQSVLIRATPDGFNYYFDEALKAFQKEYDKNSAQCQRRRLTSNTTSPDDDFIAWAQSWGTAEVQPPLRQFEGGAWDPHHKMLIPTIYFYRYDGSLTEPPCSELVTWFIADKPMAISIEQLEQLKRILFTNVDSNCRTTSVQNEHSVARPIRLTNNRPVSKCTASDFGPDTG